MSLLPSYKHPEFPIHGKGILASLFFMKIGLFRYNTGFFSFSSLYCDRRSSRRVAFVADQDQTIQKPCLPVLQNALKRSSIDYRTIFIVRE